MNRIQRESLKNTLKYLDNLSQKSLFTSDEIHYIDYAPLSLLTERFSLNKNVLNDLTFVYPILYSVERAIGELVSRVDNIDKYTFAQKIYKLVLMHKDIVENEKETDLLKLKEKLSNKKFQNMFDFFIGLKEIRNDVSHLRFTNLEYKGKSLSKYEIRSLLLFDLYSFNQQ